MKHRQALFPAMAFGLISLTWAPLAHADAVASLRAFVKGVKSAQGEFTQTVTSPDGKKARKSTGSL